MAVLGVAVIAAGRVFGYVELFLVGTALVLLVLGAVAFASLTSLRLEIGRVVRPPRVHAGGRCEVVLAVRNGGRRRTPVIGLHDRLRGRPGARLLAAPIERGARTAAGYTLPTDERGVIEIGPLTVDLTDPFGLASTTTTAVGRTTVTVYPRTAPIAPPPRTGGADPQGRRSAGLHHEGDEFHSLRPYVLGDDLRRVHWAATARSGELVVRQVELHRHGRTTVVLDNRADHHVGHSFEVAVEAAASVLLAAHRRGDELRLLSTGGEDSGVGDDDPHLDRMLSWLATAQARAGVEPVGTMAARHRASVRVTTDIGLEDNAVVTPFTIVVATGPTGAEDDGRVGHLRISSLDDLADAWPVSRSAGLTTARP